MKRNFCALISSLAISGKKFSWCDRKTNKWITGDNSAVDVEASADAISWQTEGCCRVLLLNLVVPIVKKNVDVSLLDCSNNNFELPIKSLYCDPAKYIVLGELKGGIDPAGADEHWKTANSALERIRKSFSKKKLKPFTFFIGAAIEKAMADEIFKQLQKGTLACAGNLTNDKHLVEICGWLIEL